VSDALADAVKTYPDLHLIVVTMQGHADNIVTGSWARECFDRVKRRRPDFELYALKVGAEDASGSLSLEEVDNHAKLMIVDDIFLTIGSCNINDRGFEFEGECNLAVVDPALVKGLRAGLFREHLGDPRVSGDIDADAALWREHADSNRTYDVGSRSPPASCVFPFEPRAKRRIIFGHSVF
jgi:phosphatidylserine/phosphatidylglycerophosphate/cardiolipin synthase-like enzyme